MILAKFQKYTLLAKLWVNRHSYTFQLVKPYGTIWPYLRKLLGHLSSNPEILILGVYPEDTYPILQKYIYTGFFTEALFIVVKYWKLLRHPNLGD